MNLQLSILIRNLNEGNYLRYTLDMLKRQQVDFGFEIVVVDNESEDESVKIAESAGCRVFSLKRSEFTFGHSLNFGIERCQGEIIVILSAHVILLNEFFLQNIPAYFNDAKVGALRFVQSGSSEELIAAVDNGAQKLVYSPNSNFAMDNWKRFIVNHCAAIRRSCWELEPFDEKIFASEDKAWSLAVLKKGYTILYNVPCFYMYIKPFSPHTRTTRTIIEEAAKEIITGTGGPMYSVSYARSVLTKIVSGLKRICRDVKIHTEIYRGVRQYKRKSR